MTQKLAIRKFCFKSKSAETSMHLSKLSLKETRSKTLMIAMGSLELRPSTTVYLATS